MSFWTKTLNGYIEGTPAIQNAVKETVSPADSQLDKARKLYAVVQKIENTDFNSDGAPLSGSEWIPRGKVESVLLAKKGSSNEIAFFYLALMRTAGIQARPERIASRSIRVFSAQYMSNIQLDTVLIELNIDGKADPCRSWHEDGAIRDTALGARRRGRSGDGREQQGPDRGYANAEEHR